MKTALLDILHVDDDANDQLLVRVACKEIEISVNVEPISNGAQAIAYLDRADPYTDHERFPSPLVMLLDLTMPIKSGFEVLEWVREQPRFKYFVIIIFSASKIEVDMQRAYDLGANGYVVKPNTLAGLVEALAAIKSFWIDLNE